MMICNKVKSFLNTIPIRLKRSKVESVGEPSQKSFKPISVLANGERFKLTSDLAYDEVFLKVKDKNNKSVGYEYITLPPKSLTIKGDMISVSRSQERKGLGEILRLGSIIEMIENKRDNFKILSLGEALGFHTKYKFKPNMTTQGQLTGAIGCIQRYKDNKYLSVFAKQIEPYKKASNKGYEISDDIRNQKINEIFGNFLNKAVEKNIKINHEDLYCGVDMVLSKETIQQNKKFFNKLFKKHRIDYNV